MLIWFIWTKVIPQAPELRVSEEAVASGPSALEMCNSGWQGSSRKRKCDDTSLFFSL